MSISSTPNDVGINRGNPKSWLIGALLLGSGVPERYIHAPPHVGYRAEFGRCWSKGTGRIYGAPPETGLLAVRLSRSLKAFRTGNDRSRTSTFVLTFHLYRF